MGESQDLRVRIADIAAAAGLHFGNRAKLLLTAVQFRDSKSPTETIRRAAEEDAVPTALANFVRRWFEHIARIEPLAHLLSAASQTDPEAKLAWEDRMAPLRRHSLTLGKRLSKSGLLKPEWTAKQARIGSGITRTSTAGAI